MTTLAWRTRVKAELKMKKCNYCNATKNLTIDHKQPIILGGSNDIKNLQVLCQRCNSMKSGVPHGQLMRLVKWWIEIKGLKEINTMKIKIKDNEIVEVKVKKEFEHGGVTLCLHRPYGSEKDWICSEKNTGLAVGYSCATMDKTAATAREQINAGIEKSIDITGLIGAQEKIN